MKMRRITATLLVLALLLVCLPFQASAAYIASGTCGPNAAWTLSDSGVLTIYGTGEMYDYAYSAFDTMYLKPWLEYSKSIKSIYVAEGITSIGDYTFYNDTNVETIQLPEGITRIGECAFLNLRKVTSISLPNSLVELEKGAFEGCDGLTHVTLPANLKVVGGGAFESCSNLGSVIFPEGLTTIEAYAFAFTKLTKVTAPSSLTTIGKEAFTGCQELKEVVLNEGLKEMKAKAFAHCPKLTSVKLPGTLKKMYEDVFEQCGALKELVIPAGVKYMNGSLDGAYGLKTVWFMGHAPVFSMTSASDSLTVYYPSNSVSWTEEVRSKYEGNITWIPFESPDIQGNLVDQGTYGDNIQWTFTEDNTLTLSGTGPMEMLFGDVPWHIYEKRIESLVIQEGITTIEGYIFSYLEELTFVSIPSTVTTIGSMAFHRCTKLEEVVIPNGVKEIGSSAFSDCYSLRKVEIADSVTNIDHSVFANCYALQEIKLPAGLEVLRKDTFYNTGFQEFEIPEGIKELEDAVFDGLELKRIVFPASLEKIGFQVCSTVTEEAVFLGSAPEAQFAIFAECTATIFYPYGDETWTEEIMQTCAPNATWKAKCFHNYETVTVEADCITPGTTTHTCTICGDVQVEPEMVPPQGHDYGLDADGNPDFWDTTCDVCGAERVVDKHRPTHSMFRMYNPNSGEHFYTGSMVERQNLEAAGWKYEGVGFTFPATTGKPVYRLYDRDNTKEHLYTMDEAEKDKLLAEGWILEGVAFNSGREDEVPQYRLHNPNATIGAYHFTASIEERDALIAAGWEDQGIGFYTCLQ